MERSRCRDARRPQLHRLLVAVAIAIWVALVGACGNDTVPPPSDGPVSSAPAASGPKVARATPAATPSPRRSPSPSPRPTPTPTPKPAATPLTAQAPTCVGAESTIAGSQAGGSSQNWAGYIVRQAGARVVCVQGRWTEPKLSCPAKGDRSIAIWLGIDGAGPVSKTRPLIQLGTWGYCHNGVENHYAWHEVYPNQPYSVGFSTPIRPGDRVAAAVVFRQRAFTLTLVNLTTGRRGEVVEQAPKAVRGTAEWIVEAPTGGCPKACHQLTLPGFVPVKFTTARATLGSQVAGIDGPWTRERTTMVSRHGTLAKVGPLTASGEGFTVTHP